MSDVLFELRDRVGLITLNRPAALNAFAERMREELVETFAQVASNDQVRVIVVTGAGRGFCAGADVRYMRDLIERGDWEAARELVLLGATVVSAIDALDKPVIAAVNGPAAGGGANLALACDVRIAAESASIGQTFNRIGLQPDWGGSYFLPRLVGLGKALELIFTGEMVGALEAGRLGIFNRVVPDDRLMAEVFAMAEMLSAKPPLALALAKRAIRHQTSSLAGTLNVELDHQMQLFKTHDVKEGVDAFLEKRSPTYQGR